MTGFIIRIFIALVLLAGTVGLFFTGFWGWGLSSVIPLAAVIFSFFRNEQVILALNQMRLGNQEKAKKHINRITAPQYMTRRQHAYVLYLKALMNAQELGFAQSEQLLATQRMLRVTTISQLLSSNKQGTNNSFLTFIGISKEGESLLTKALVNTQVLIKTFSILNFFIR